MRFSVAQRVESWRSKSTNSKTTPFPLPVLGTPPSAIDRRPRTNRSQGQGLLPTQHPERAKGLGLQVKRSEDQGPTAKTMAGEERRRPRSDGEDKGKRREVKTKVRRRRRRQAKRGVGERSRRMPRRWSSPNDDVRVWAQWAVGTRL